MISLGVSRGPSPEARSFSSAVLNAIESAAAGTGGSVAAATAAVETAAGWWLRTMATASVEPMNRRTAALTPARLAMIGRALCRSGEIVFDLDVADGRLVMLPASSAHVTTGTVDPRTWIYTLTTNGPSESRTQYRRREGVAHLQTNVDPDHPWIGRPPWASASLSGRLLAGVERQLASEADARSGYIMATPDTGDRGEAENSDGDDDPLKSLREDLHGANGRTVLAPSQTGGYGAGPAVAPQREYTSKRFGLEPPEATVELRRDVGRDVLAACGIPPVLANHAAPGTSMREGWRQLVVGTIQPMATIAASQLSEALGESVSLTVPRAADVATLARAVQSLVNAGMPVAEARAVVGI